MFKQFIFTIALLAVLAKADWLQADNGPAHWSFTAPDQGIAFPYTDQYELPYLSSYATKMSVSNGTGYVNTGYGQLLGYNLLNGQITFSVPVSSSSYNPTGAPAIYNGNLYVQTQQGTVQAYSIQTTRLLWTYYDQMIIKTDSQTLHTPAVDTVNQFLYFSSPSGNLYALHLTNGTIAWSYRNSLLSNVAVINSSPVLSSDGSTVCSSWSSTSYNQGGFQVACLDTATGNPILVKSYPATTSSNDVSLDSQGRIYILGTGQLQSINITSGEIIWQTFVGSAGATPIIIDEAHSFLFFVTQNGLLYTIDLHTGLTVNYVSSSNYYASISLQASSDLTTPVHLYVFSSGSVYAYSIDELGLNYCWTQYSSCYQITPFVTDPNNMYMITCNNRAAYAETVNLPGGCGRPTFPSLQNSYSSYSYSYHHGWSTFEWILFYFGMVTALAITVTVSVIFIYFCCCYNKPPVPPPCPPHHPPHHQEPVVFIPESSINHQEEAPILRYQ